MKRYVDTGPGASLGIGRRRLGASLLAAPLLAAPALAFGQTHATEEVDFPNRPVTIVVPHTPGGSTDILIRRITHRMSEVLGRSVVVDNRPGAGTMIAAAYVAKAPKDGYTLMLATPSTLATNPFLIRSMPYRVSDFTPVALVARTPFVLEASPMMPPTIREFQAYAKARPGQLSIGTAGRGSSPHIVAGLICDALGITMTDVPYRGSSVAITDLITGRLDTNIDGITGLAGQYPHPTLRVLAMTGEERSEAMPDVPTMIEAGFPDVVAYVWYGLIAPVGTPPGAVAKLSAAVAKTLEDAELVATLRRDGNLAASSGPEEFGRYIKEETERWGAVIRKLNIEMD